MTESVQVHFEENMGKWAIGLGLTPVTAEKLLRSEFPDIPQWMLWNIGHDRTGRALQAFVGEGLVNNGRVGAWRWERIPCSYCNLGFWSGSMKMPRIGIGWTGVLRITGPEGGQFLIFSYLRADMKFNSEYMVSTGDLPLLRKFADDVYRCMRPRRNKTIINVNVIGALNDFELKARDVESVYLPRALEQDIYAQIDGFFGSKQAYMDMNIPYKRGFLFVGQPGTGKTMLIRNIIRHVHTKFRIRTSFLSINKKTDADDLRQLFSSASEKEPALLILEDVESLCHEAQLTRSEVLAEFDGIAQRSGMLLIATANDPSKIDAALVHRPSRFDRVWNFPLPDLALRRRYISEQYKSMDPELVEFAASQTEGWTFAYIKEMRSTAGILAMREGRNSIDQKHIKMAFHLLKEQFNSGKCGHFDPAQTGRKVGFGCDDTPDDSDAGLEVVAA